jgi:hypothetical protein
MTAMCKQEPMFRSCSGFFFAGKYLFLLWEGNPLLVDLGGEG